MSQTTAPAQENKMGVMPMNRLIFNMAVPMMLSMLVQACYNIVDSMFVAMLSENALTAVSMAFPLQNIMISLTSGTGVGINAMLSKALGERRQDEANRAASNGVFLALCSFLLFVVIGAFFTAPFFHSQTNVAEIAEEGIIYGRICMCASIGICLQMTFERMMQGAGHTLCTMFTQMTGAVINIILDPLLIFGIGFFPKMGVAGAAAATVIGQCAAAVLAIIFNRIFNKDIYVGIHAIFQPSWRVIKRIYYVGIPSTVMACIGSIMYYFMNLILGVYGSTACAVFGVYFKLQSFFFMPVFGLNNAIVPIIAYNYGAGKRSRMLQALKTGIFSALAIMLIGTACFQLIPGTLLGLFSASDNMLAMGVPALRIISFHFPVAAICIVLGSVFQSLGKAIFSMFTSIGRQIVVLLPVAFLLSMLGGIHAVWWCFLFAELMSLLLTLIFFVRIYRSIILQVPNNE